MRRRLAAIVALETRADGSVEGTFLNAAGEERRRLRRAFGERIEPASVGEG